MFKNVKFDENNDDHHATAYELIHDDRSYAPKAVTSLACLYSIGRILQPEEFRGSEASGQAKFVLRKLGFGKDKYRY